MAETPEQIERYIEQKRNDLTKNVFELQQKMDDALDWRVQFQQHPFAMIGLAFGGGLLLASVLGWRH